MLIALPWLVAIVGQSFVVAARTAERDWKAFAVNAAGLLVMSAAWLALMLFLGHRAYLAIP